GCTLHARAPTRLAAEPREPRCFPQDPPRPDACYIVCVMVRGLRRAFLAAAAALAVACASPTLPLPPPATPTVSQTSTPGVVHLVSTHGAEPNAIIVIVNHNTSVPLDKRVSGSQADS